MAEGLYTWEEIVSQPETWRGTLDAFATRRAELERFLGREHLEHIVVMGCGSTHYLAQTAAVTISHHSGIPARALPSSELWLFPGTAIREHTLLLAVSRSGARRCGRWSVSGK